MKKLISAAVSAVCAFAAAMTFTGCGAGKSTQLGKPAQAAAFAYSEYSDGGYISIKDKANEFAYALSASAYSSYQAAGNFSVAPISVFSALSLAAECAGGLTRGEILSALGVGYNELSADYSKLYRSLESEYYSSGGSLEGALNISNSVWLNEGVIYDVSCVQSLSQKYFAYSYSADFAGDNANANKAVRAFVKDKTHKLIDTDFDLSPQTVFTLINALYLKDVWNTYGDDLGFTAQKYDFTARDGNVKNLNLLQGYYQTGRALNGDGYRSFFVKTLNGYKIKYIVPESGRSADEIFTAENLAAINSAKDYSAVDDENRIVYNTRCLFPEFETSYDSDIAELLKSDFGINRLFDPSLCDFSALMPTAAEGDACCGSVRHVNKLKVNKKGIEGAAVTVLPAAGAAGPGEYTYVYEDFVVDKAFGFILTDYRDTVIFTGVVNGI